MGPAHPPSPRAKQTTATQQHRPDEGGRAPTHNDQEQAPHSQPPDNNRAEAAEQGGKAETAAREEHERRTNSREETTTAGEAETARGERGRTQHHQQQPCTAELAGDKQATQAAADHRERLRNNRYLQSRSGEHTPPGPQRTQDPPQPTEQAGGATHRAQRSLPAP